MATLYWGGTVGSFCLSVLSTRLTNGGRRQVTRRCINRLLVRAFPLKASRDFPEP